MSGDIKFRGRRTKDNKWVYGWYVEGVNSYIITPKNFENAVVSISGNMATFSDIVDHLTASQYVDNICGVEIYHHDIIRAYKHGDLETSPFTLEITKRNATWWVGNWTWIEFVTIFRFIEVIGNIHDNPELLGNI